MNITLSQKEIETAVQQFVAGQGIAVTGKQMSVKFTMTRNPSGISAEIILEDANATQIPGFTDRPADTSLALVNNSSINSAADVTSEAKTATTPAANTIGAAIAGVIGTTAKDVGDLVTDGNSGDTTTDVAAEAVKSVPEDTAAVVDAGAAPAPAAATTNSLFGS